MAYSQALVIAGGLAHIPIVTGLFWVFDKSNNPKTTSPKAVKKLATKPKASSTLDVTKKTKPLTEILVPEGALNTETINQEPTSTEELKMEEGLKNKESNDIEQESIDKSLSDDSTVNSIDMDTLSLD